MLHIHTEDLRQPAGQHALYINSNVSRLPPQVRNEVLSHNYGRSTTISGSRGLVGYATVSRIGNLEKLARTWKKKKKDNNSELKNKANFYKRKQLQKSLNQATIAKSATLAAFQGATNMAGVGSPSCWVSSCRRTRWHEQSARAERQVVFLTYIGRH